MIRYIFYTAVLLLLPLWAAAQLNTDRLTAIGRNALYFEDYVLSIQYFNQVIRVKPYLVEPYFYRGVAKIQLEDYVGAEKDMDEVIRRNPFIPMAFYARGFARKQLGKWEEAREDFSRALEFSPENPIFMVNRIETYEEMKEYDAALADLDFLIRRTPEEIGLRFEKGRLLLEKGDTVGALPEFDTMVRIDSVNPEVWSARGFIRLITEDNEGALADYDKAVKLKSRNIATYINRGILNYEAKNYRAALADYDKAVSLDTASVQALYNRALLRTEVGDYNTAIEDYNTVIALRPDMPEARYQRALVYGEVGEWRLAIKDFSDIIGRYPSFVPALYGRAQAYENLGNDKLAFADREKAYDITQAHKNNDRKEEDIDVDVKVAGQEGSVIKNRASIFSSSGTEEESSQHSLRGAIQNLKINVTNENNFVLSYYYRNDTEMPVKPYSHPAVQEFNDRHRLEAPVYIVCDEMPLTEGMIGFHFASIDRLSEQIAADSLNADLYMARGMDYALVQDFPNAIADFSSAIHYGNDEEMALAYFSRANVRYKQLEFKQNNVDMTRENISKALQDEEEREKIVHLDKGDSYEFEMIMRDYDRVIALLPDFAYAWYNRANMLCVQKDYQSAIGNYSRAIELNPELGEAYFNRGLTYIYLGNEEHGVADLSKAGELGIYQAYSIMKRLNNN